MKEKLSEILSNSKNIITETDKKNILQSRLLQELIDIAGIGKSKADKLIQLGLKDIKQLKQKKWESYINTGTKLLLNKKPLTAIPNSLIKTIEPKLTSFKLAKTKLVGGFLRKKPFSKDIDVMIISDSDIIDDYIKYLENTFSYVKVYIKGSDKASVIISISNEQYLKMDIFVSPKKYQYAMLLYATGSKQFNIRMRGIAKRMGYVLNQYGLYKLPINPNSTPLPVNSEKDFFKILEIPYIPPPNR
jgi:DNA polymerase (family 10)